VITYDDALKKALERDRTYDICYEFDDSWVFTYDCEEDEVYIDLECVIMKTGEVIDYTEDYFDEHNIDDANIIRIE